MLFKKQSIGICTSLFLLIFTILFNLGGVKAQSLSADIKIIEEANDLMGGIVLVFCAEELIEVLPFGKADLDRDISVTDSTQFRIASISKTITALAVMQLYEAGLLDLDKNVSNYLGFDLVNPSHPQKAITARMLLSHTSTIIDGSGYGSFLSASYSDNPIPPISALLSSSGAFYTSDLFNNTIPGSYFNYSNLNFGVLGTLVEKVSGQRFDQYCKNKILQPLGIKGSFNVNDIENIDNVSVLYRKINGFWIPQADNYQGIQPVFTNLDSYVIGDNGLRFGPQGGLRVSGPEVAKLFQLFLNGGTLDGIEILQASTVEEMMTTEWLYDGTNGNNYYGLFNSWGLGLHKSTNSENQDVVLQSGNPMLGHPGEAYGLVSDAYVDTEKNLGLVLLINGNGSGYSTNNFSAFYSIEKAVFDAINTYDYGAFCIPNSVQNRWFSEARIYPNPVDSFFVIEQLQQLGDQEAQLYNSAGELITSYTIQGGQVSGLAELKTGVYFLRISGSETLIRFVKR